MELSVKVTLITEYDKALQEQKKGNTVWTIIDNDGTEHCEQKLIKENGLGWLVLSEKPEEIIIFKREKWKVV